MRGWTGGRPLPPPAPLPPPSHPLVSLLPSGAARAWRAQKFHLSPSLPFFLPSPSSRPLFSLLPLLPPPAPSSPSSLLPPPLLPPPSPSSPPSRPLFSPLPLTLSAPSWIVVRNKQIAREPLRGSRDLFVPRYDSFPMNPEKKTLIS